MDMALSQEESETLKDNPSDGSARLLHHAIS
jgi:hypothetical protein